MKFSANKRYNTIALYSIIVIAVNVLLVVAIWKFGTLVGILSSLLTALTPIIWGLVIAFLLNPIMVKVEAFSDKRIKRPKKKKIRRILSVTLSSIVFLGIVIGIIAVIIPQLIDSMKDITDNISTLVNKSQDLIGKLFSNYPKAGKFISEKVVTFSTDITKLQPLLENILSGAIGFVNVLKNFVLGYILSIYLLFNKELLLAQFKKIMYAHFKKNTCHKMFSFFNHANKTFSGFLFGKVVDSLIIGIICFIVLAIVNMPYSILISVIVGVTNIIPFFGPIIGAVPSALLVLLVEPGKFIWLLVIILLLQQFDGNILGPKILGGSTGLPAIWVMISLFIGGEIFGFVGMILAVPAFALIYSLVRSAVENKLIKKKMPVSTEYYLDNDNELSGKDKKKHVPLTPEQLQKIELPPLEDANEAK